AVLGGLYRLIRHPQYVALIVAGTGVALIWPRFIVLFALVTMAFLYVSLARHEERICLSKFGDSYRDYMARTGAFFPRIPFLSPAAPSDARGRLGLTLTAYMIAIVVAGAAAYGMREHSLANLAAVFEERQVILSPALLSDDELRRAYALALEDSRVDDRRKREKDPAVSIVYVVPTDWYMPDLPIDPHDLVVTGGHSTPKSFDRSKLQVLFTVARTFQPDARGKGILRHANGIRPIALADIDLSAGIVVRVVDPPRTVVWGNIPMPLF
ncbi:MAG: isoprenylcysteine carboxylmethyltransferase family protein, partial [Micropepsaceae bacterium]